MPTKTDFDATEWKQINAAPFLAGLYVTLADPSGFVGVAKEAMAVSKLLADSAKDSSSQVIRSLVEDLKAQGFGARPELPDLPKRDLAEARAVMAEHIDQATAAIAAKSPEEAQEFKQWLMTAAHKVAEASKEGGFLGFGGTLVSEDEKKAIDELAAKLGVQA